MVYRGTVEVIVMIKIPRNYNCELEEKNVIITENIVPISNISKVTSFTCSGKRGCEFSDCGECLEYKLNKNK
jgi:hypothetical protein